MAEVHHFTYGWVTPTLAYALSVLGSVLGLTCAVRARQTASAGRRAGWLLMAAFALGGTGIWTMHFMAMLGFGVVGMDIRYDVPLTAISAVVAIVVVSVGLFLVGSGGHDARPAGWRVLAGGVIAGLGVNAMHYIGMGAMRLDGDIRYDSSLVAASVVIALAAATVALWLSVTVRRGPAIIGSAFVMGFAVCGMHYTGMAAMSVAPNGTAGLTGQPAGAPASTLIVPIVLAVVFVVVGLAFVILSAPSDEDRAAAAFLDARLAQAPAGTAAPAAPAGTAEPAPPRAAPLRYGEAARRVP